MTRSAAERPGWRRWAVPALLVLAAVVPLFRQRGTPSWQTVWAEDGSIYSQQAVLHGGLHVLFRGYHGYLQLPPRILALAVPYFPLRFLALYASLTSTIVAALLAWSIFHFSRGWIASTPVRLALASLVVVAPAMEAESTASMTNTIWLFLAALPWALVSLEETKCDTTTRSTVAFLAATSSALSFLFLPLGIGWWVYRRSRSAAIVGGSFVIGLIIQGLAVLQTEVPQHLPLPPTASFASLLAEGTSVRVFGVSLVGTRWEAELWHANWLLLSIAGPVIVLIAVALLMPGAGRKAQVMSAAFLVLAVVMFAVPAWGRGVIGLLLMEGGADGQGYVRFTVPAVALVIGALAMLIAPAGRARPSPRLNVGVPLLVAQVALLAVVCFPVTTTRGADTPWMGRVDRAWVEHCAGRRGSSLVTVPNQVAAAVYFQGFPKGLFPVTVRCADLR